MFFKELRKSIEKSFFVGIDEHWSNISLFYRNYNAFYKAVGFLKAVNMNPAVSNLIQSLFFHADVLTTFYC